MELKPTAIVKINNMFAHHSAAHNTCEAAAETSHLRSQTLLPIGIRTYTALSIDNNFNEKFIKFTPQIRKNIGFLKSETVMPIRGRAQCMNIRL